MDSQDDSLDIFLMRHGQAASGNPDHLRELTPRGREESRAVGRLLAAADTRPAVIWSSPFRRAKQTALIIAEELYLPVTDCEFITPDDDPTEALEKLGELSRESGIRSLLLVSHMPFIGGLTSLLTEGHTYGSPYGTSELRWLTSGVWASRCASQQKRWLA